MHDVIIVGGSYAGLSAALMLARARRDVLIIDGGKRRNRFAGPSHGFLTQDGALASNIAAQGRAQVEKYPTVSWLEADTSGGAAIDGGFVLTAGRERHEARRLLLAIGVTDELPAIPGLAERWGKSVFHCPYCDGYELNQGQIGVLASSAMSMHHALMLPDWGKTTFFLNGSFLPDADQLAQLAARGVTVEATPVVRIEGERAGVVLADGRRIDVGGLFTATRIRPSSPIADQLGCAMEDGPTGPYVRTDAMKQTSVPGIFACGDIAKPFGSVAQAVGDGNFAGASVHRTLMFGLG
jgi:thioredoxin reductase